MGQQLKITLEQLTQFAKQSKFAGLDFVEPIDEIDAQSTEDTVDLSNTGTLELLPTNDRNLDAWGLTNDIE